MRRCEGLLRWPACCAAAAVAKARLPFQTAAEIARAAGCCSSSVLPGRSEPPLFSQGLRQPKLRLPGWQQQPQGVSRSPRPVPATPQGDDGVAACVFKFLRGLEQPEGSKREAIPAPSLQDASDASSSSASPACVPKALGPAQLAGVALGALICTTGDVLHALHALPAHYTLAGLMGANVAVRRPDAAAIALLTRAAVDSFPRALKREHLRELEIFCRAGCREACFIAYNPPAFLFSTRRSSPPGDLRLHAAPRRRLPCGGTYFLSRRRRRRVGGRLALSGNEFHSWDEPKRPLIPCAPFIAATLNLVIPLRPFPAPPRLLSSAACTRRSLQIFRTKILSTCSITCWCLVSLATASASLWAATSWQVAGGATCIWGYVEISSSLLRRSHNTTIRPCL